MLTTTKKMFILQFATSTCWPSDYTALNDGAKATVNMDCIIDTEVLSITSKDREKLCSEIYQLSYFFRWRLDYPDLLYRGWARPEKRGDDNDRYSIFTFGKDDYSYFIAAVILKYSITVLVSFFNSPFLSALWLIFVKLIYLTGSPGDS
jgi:hypothetical protein